MSDISQVAGVNFAELATTRTNLVFNQESFDNGFSEADRARIAEQVRNGNLETQMAYGREVKQVMDKDDFLKILITQLQNQDPTKPMEDREFIAQMAQFSSLEQMTNLSSGFERLAGMLSSNQALGVLGREVDLVVDGQLISGPVTEVTQGDFPQVLVNGQYYDYSDVARVKEL